jgi:hypothetical protein
MNFAAQEGYSFTFKAVHLQAPVVNFHIRCPHEDHSVCYLSLELSPHVITSSETPNCELTYEHDSDEITLLVLVDIRIDEDLAVRFSRPAPLLPFTRRLPCGRLRL